jgi:fucose permease
VYLTCLCFFFIVGQEAGFAGWVSPYAVLQNFSNKEHATMYSSMYWISITISRFVLASVKGSDAKKM